MFHQNEPPQSSKLTWHNGGTYSEKVYAGCSCTLAHKRDVAWIAAEVLDVLLDPVQRCNLIHQAVVGHSSFRVGRDVGVEEAQNAESVVQRDYDLVGVARQHRAVVGVATAPVIALAMDEHQNRMLTTAFRHS